ncbi:hydroxymethylglutaryl-CoA lyase [Pseudonocardia sulfidoxydans NBRC 16205]|uniref:Hydroxymethylglutaryl-CoA lyase n=1 Tax=Pseudonocardia sulfidoxydans NBRC 16205 TaxID=1223511 RepID=A0A511D8D6_9PSEU|nr:hydroxymethylglutaryl-CoA lyase [Pseudonocardia sulfidoxydans]GEL21060.1 hydroxymethylglutaryl-CoA lyase [Pseudonocardia sulfidoxydans NBRC 16205]
MAEEPQARIVEVLLRDGLQTMVYESDWHVPTTEEKLELIEMLADAGIPELEVTGFVHPKVIPMLADASEVVQRLPDRPGTVYRALVPNLRGAQRAIAAGCTKLSALIVASETYNKKNSNMTLAENVEQIRQITELAKSEKDVVVNVSMGCCFLCPYEGEQSEEHILGLIETFVGFGITEVSIADSIGMANPRMVGKRVKAITSRWPELTLGMHMHDRTGMALANIVAAFDNGATLFETCAGGYGGGISMPVSVLGMGNVPTEDVVNMFDEMGIPTGVDLGAVRKAAERTAEIIGLPTYGRVSKYGTYQEFHELALQHIDAPARGNSALQK